MTSEPQKVPLTKTRITALPVPAAGRCYVHDDKTPGLCVAVTATGTRTFYLYRWLNGGPLRIRIGCWPDLSVEQARAEAMKLTGLMAQGINPMERKRAAREEAARGKAALEEATLGDLWTRYLTVHARPKKKPSSVAEDEGLYRRHLAAWAGRKLSKIRKPDVEELHAAVGTDTPYQANRLLALTHALFEHAAALGFAGPNPAHGIERFTEVSRERFLQADELPAFFKALRNEPNTKYRDFFLICLFTGARRGNVQSMRWADLALDRGTWTIPDTKAGRPQTVALSPFAVAILRARQANAGGSEWVFPGRREGRYLGEPAKVWATILARAGIKDLRIHDLRRTLGSWAAAGGVSLQIIGKALGHSNPSTTQIYSRLNIDSVRAAIDTTVMAMVTAGGAEMLLPALVETRTTARAPGRRRRRS
jgi:integrase